jgi:replicative DNA helicase
MSQLIDPSIARQFDRLPPNDVDAEVALIGSLLRLGHEKATLAKVRQIIDRESFYQVDHQLVYDVVCHLHDSGKAVDLLSVREALERRQVLEEVGGATYLAKLFESVFTPAHAAHYASIIREKSKLRALIALANDTLRSVYAPAADDVAEKLALELSAAAAKVATTGMPHQVHRLGDVAVEVFESKEKGQNPRIETGLRDLDRLIGGLRKGGKTIFGAKAGMGKSLLLKQIGLNVACRGVPFGIISVEESRHKIAENTVANVSGIINNHIAFGRLDPGEWKAFAEAVNGLTGVPFFIIDSARRLSSIVAAAHVLRAEYDCQVVGVDHLHIVDGESERNENREREISKISGELKWRWKDLDVAGVEVAQLNRQGGRDRPTLASLRDSGSLEQDADTVILLHREDYYRGVGEMEDHVLEAVVAKNKDGATGTVPLRYDGARQRIGDRNTTAAEVSDD